MELDVIARTWVQSNFEVAIAWSDWTTADYWEFIEEFYIGGKHAFIAANDPEDDQSYRGEYNNQW